MTYTPIALSLVLIVGFTSPQPVLAAPSPQTTKTPVDTSIPKLVAPISSLPPTTYTELSTLSPIAIPKPAPPAPVAAVSGCGDNAAANYIYMHESGCNLSAINAGGCRGLGQACPGSKLPCGADYACQNAWFTSYASSAYGGWDGAYQHWLQFSWW